jgi:hypothetical protein
MLDATILVPVIIATFAFPAELNVIFPFSYIDTLLFPLDIVLIPVNKLPSPLK